MHTHNHEMMAAETAGIMIYHCLFFFLLLLFLTKFIVSKDTMTIHYFIYLLCVSHLC